MFYQMPKETVCIRNFVEIFVELFVESELFSNDNILDITKLKPLAEDNLGIAKITKSVIG